MPNNSFINNPRLSTKEAATFIGCASSTLKMSRGSGTLLGRKPPRYLKLGSKVLYDLKDLQDWIDQFDTRNNTAD